MGKQYYLKTPDEPFRRSPHDGLGKYHRSIEWARVRAEEVARSGSSPPRLHQLVEVKGGFKHGTHRVIAEHRTGYGWGMRTELLIDWDSMKPSLPLSQKRDNMPALYLIPHDGKVTRPKDISMTHLPSDCVTSTRTFDDYTGYASGPPTEPIAGRQQAHIHSRAATVNPTTRQRPTLSQAVTFHE